MSPRPPPLLGPAELAAVVRRFSQTGIQDFLTLTLTEQTGLLYVGAREALFAFSVEALELQGAVRGGGAGGTQVWGEWQDPKGCSLRKLAPQPCSSLWKSLSSFHSHPSSRADTLLFLLCSFAAVWGFCSLLHSRAMGTVYAPLWCPHVAAKSHACGRYSGHVLSGYLGC